MSQETKLEDELEALREEVDHLLDRLAMLEDFIQDLKRNFRFMSE